MLKFHAAWRFDSPGPIPDGVVNDLLELIGKIAAQTNRKRVLEHFKSYFAAAAGLPSTSSSNVSWAESDLDRDMRHASENAPLFVEAFYDACEALRQNGSELAIPDVNRINRVLAEHGAGFEIRPPNLVAMSHHAVPIVVENPPPSLDQQAQEIIQKSLSDSEQLLAEGRHRQAIQEILWLLETVSTAFKGIQTNGGTVQGKYFNKIAEDLRRHNKGTTLDQVLGWITTLHGYLSSPSGGGVRHGTDLRDGIAVQPNEARLYCNLIRSYVSFLMTEHHRLTRP